MSPDFLEALVALREEVARAYYGRLVLMWVITCRVTHSCLQHTRRLAAIEGQYYGGSAAVGNDDAGAADEESHSLTLPSRAHGGGTAAEANDSGDRRSGARPLSTSAAGRKADGLVRVASITHECRSNVTLPLFQFPASAKAAASAALPPRPSSARARAPSPSVRDSTDHPLPARTRPATAHARPSPSRSHSIGGGISSAHSDAAITATTVADILGQQSSSDDDEPLFDNLNARASSALHSELSPRSRAFAHKVGNSCVDSSVWC